MRKLHSITKYLLVELCVWDLFIDYTELRNYELEKKSLHWFTDSFSQVWWTMYKTEYLSHRELQEAWKLYNYQIQK